MSKYKVRVWKADKTYTEYNNINIYFDDKVRIISSKITKEISSPYKFYMWAEKKVQDKVHMCNSIIHSMFKGRTYISATEFSKSFTKLFPGKVVKTKSSRLEIVDVFTSLMDFVPDTISLRLLYEMKTQTVYNYIFPVNPFDATIEDISSTPLTIYDTSNTIIHDFYPVDNIINVIDNGVASSFLSEDLQKMYFPPSQISLSHFMIDDSFYEKVLTSISGDVDPFIKKIYTVVQPIGPATRVKLQSLFDTYVLDSSTPMVKYRTSKEIIYKIDRAALSTVPPDFVEQWTTDVYKIKNEALIFKLNYGEFYASLFVFCNLSYQIKLTFKNEQDVRNLAYIEEMIVPHINHVIFKIKEMVPMIITKNIIIPTFTSNMISQQTMLELVVDTNLTFSHRMPNIAKIEAKLLEMTPLFHKIYNFQMQAQNVIILRYKKCSTYSPSFDINAFIMSHINKLTRQQLITALISTFQISRKLAESLANEHTTFLSKNFDGITVKLTRKNDIEINVSIKGTHYDIVLAKHIIQVIHACLLADYKPPKPKPSIVNDTLYIVPNESEGAFFGSNFEEEMMFIDEEPQQDLALNNTTSHSHEANLSRIMSNDKSIPSIKTPTQKSSKHDMSRYTLRRLQEADPNLFMYVAKSKNYKSYAANCAANEKRQPIVVKKHQLESFDKNAYSNSVVIGENAYICPKIWCTASEIPMTIEQFNKEGCPRPDDYALRLHDKSAEDDKFIGFLDPSKHPKEACVPCCFLVDHRAKSSGKLKKRYDKCVGDETNDTSGDMYIKGNVYPLEKERYGRLPYVLANFLGSDECGMKISSKPCFVRKGIQHNGQYFLSCMANIFNVEDIVQIIVDNMKPHHFLFSNLLKLFISSQDSTVIDDTSFRIFKTWFLQQDEYITIFNLQDLKKEVSKATSTDKMKEPHLWELQREFIIYNSIQNFISYIQSGSVKLHTNLMALMNMPWLNKEKLNIMMLEKVDEDIFVHCRPCDTSRKFVFVVKYQQFYEIIYRVDLVGETYKFDYESYKVVKDMIDFQISNCDKVNIRTPTSAKLQVIDMSFSVVGHVMPTGKYVPLENPTDYDSSLRVVYYHDLKKFASNASAFHVSNVDLHIFTGIQLQNEAMTFLEKWKVQQDTFYGYMKLVTSEILSKQELRQEFEFLRSPMNFFQYEFKLKMMYELVMRTLSYRGMEDVDVMKMAHAMMTREISLLLTGVPEKQSQEVRYMTQREIDESVSSLVTLSLKHKSVA